MMRHHLHMPSYFLGTFTEYPFLLNNCLYIRCVKRQNLSPIDNFSSDRAFNEFPVISLSTPSTFSDYKFIVYVPFGLYLLFLNYEFSILISLVCTSVS